MTPYKKILQVVVTSFALLVLGVSIALVQWSVQRHRIVSERLDRYTADITRQNAQLQKLIAQTEALLKSTQNLKTETAEADPTLSNIEGLLTQGWLSSGQAEKTLKICQERLKSDLENISLLGTVARIYKELGDSSQSLRHFNKALSLMDREDERRQSYVDQVTELYGTMGIPYKALPLRETVAEESNPTLKGQTLR